MESSNAVSRSRYAVIDPDAAPRPGLDWVILDALDAAIVASDPEGRIFLWNRAAERLYGYGREQMLGGNVMDLLVQPQDRDQAAEIMATVRSGQSWTGEFGVRCADGSTRLVRITDTALMRGEELVGIVGQATDISAERYLEARASDREQQLRTALEAAALGTWRWDMSTGQTEWDERLEAIYGLPPGGFDGTFDTYVSLLHPDDRARTLDEVSRAMDERRAYEVRHRVVWPDGSIHWIEGRGHVTVGPDGKATGTIGCSRDVTPRVAVEQRLDRLQRVTEALAAAWTVDEVAAVVSEHAGAAIGATSGAIALTRRDGRALRLTSTFGRIGALTDLYGDDLPLELGLPLTVATRLRRPVYLASPEEIEAEYPAAAALREITGTKAVACLPLPGTSGEALGVLVLSCDVPRGFDEADRMLLDSIASQCAVALERARLMSETRRVAESLQAGLAPHDVPTVAGLDLGACYQAGGDQAEAIGGDWYDVLPQSDGTVVLVVGDVMGRGVDAAAAMTRIRSAIRAFASVDPSPDVVLSKADTFLANEFPDDFVTVLYLLLDPVTGNLRMVSAGHLPALRLAPDTEPAFLEIEDSPPVGLAGAPRVVRDDQLPRGASLLLTTDGLVERPGEDLKEALRATGITARQLLASDLSATAVAEHLVERAGPAERADDITVLIVRRT